MAITSSWNTAILYGYIAAGSVLGGVARYVLEAEDRACEFALVMRHSIVPRFEDIAAILTAVSQMPATLNLVTGPSRTADIEMTLVLGVHGPFTVHVILLEA